MNLYQLAVIWTQVPQKVYQNFVNLLGPMKEWQLRQEGVGLGQGVGHIMYRIRLQHGTMFNHGVRAVVDHMVGLVVNTEVKEGGLLQVGPNVTGPNDNNNQDNVPDQDIDHASDDSSMNISEHEQ